MTRNNVEVMAKYAEEQDDGDALEEGHSKLS